MHSPEEVNWLEEMKRWSGVTEEPEDDEPYIPGMLPDFDDDTMLRLQQLRRATEQTYRIIDEQEEMQEEMQNVSEDRQ